jgi:acetoin utilization deacetylase AcuC-like enzyme
MMQKVGFVYSDVMLKHEPPPWHPERRDRLVSIINRLKKSGLWERLVRVESSRAGLDNIALVHTRKHIETIKTFGEGSLDPDTYISKDSIEAALHAAGSVLTAVEMCKSDGIRRSFCAVRPPGHHAEADQSMGFCLFNSVAIGARFAQQTGYKKVFIVDFDAHHGNGTQHIFEEDNTVFYFSTHQYPYYPDSGKDFERGKGKGEGYTYNVQILKGSGNKEYLSVYQDIFPDLVRRFRPDLILVSAGYDIHVKDPHADIRVTGEGIRSIVNSILTSSSCPMIFVLEGGYDLEALAESVNISIGKMLA